jgi:agmatinase
MRNMDFPNYFADAEASFNAAQFIIFGIPYEQTSSFRHGAYKAPTQIRHASWNFETYNIRTKSDLQNTKIHDYGNLPVQNLSPEEMKSTVTDFTRNLVKHKKTGIALGGDHSITPGIIQALPKDTIVLSLDAHLDYRQEYEQNPMNHACVIKRITDHLPPVQIYVIGIRSAEQQEYHNAQQDNLNILDAFHLQQNGFQPEITNLYKQLQKKSIYLTIDIDVIDPAYAPATSTPEPFGLTPWDILTLIDLFSKNLIGMDIVELCPGYDHGQTALLIAKLIREMIAHSSR